MTDSTAATSPPQSLNDDCPLPLAVQNRNIWCFATFWGVYYLAAPVSYIGVTHANLLKAFGNSDTVSNLPAAVYLWLTALPVLAAWMFPHPKYLKPLALTSVALMVTITAAVAVTLGSGASAWVATAVVIAHGAVFGAANGVLLTAMWDFLRRGVSTSRRGKALGLTFGVGPLLACVGAVLQDALFGGKLLGGRSFGLNFPDNYLAMFAAVSPLLLVAGVAVAMFRIPIPAEDSSSSGTPLAEIAAGIRQFIRNRNVLIAVVIYVIVYSGGNAILQNVSLHATTILGENSDTLGIQSFLRFGFKAVAGVMLGWLLATASPRATLLATTSILLIGMTWALSSAGWWFMLTFGLLGAGELFGAYFPNYVTTASSKPFVRINMAYLSVLTAITGFSSVLFGRISDHFGRIASFYAAASLLVCALVLICVLLPPNPTPEEDEAEPVL
jgi:MFS family permease